MNASVQYNDFTGTAAADISDFLGSHHGDHIESLGKYFKIDENRFKVIGISIFGTDNNYISFLCVDKQKSTETKEYIVSMSVDLKDDKTILELLFKRLNIVLYSKFDTKYRDLKYDEEVNFLEYHESE